MERDQLELFITGSLGWSADLSWLRDEVADLYCAENGQASILRRLSG